MPKLRTLTFETVLGTNVTFPTVEEASLAALLAATAPDNAWFADEVNGRLYLKMTAEYVQGTDPDVVGTLVHADVEVQ
ncbi:MAG: hypothetical protein EYC70_01215 [Planctomycetota bacterium]|nr:MAG: hypothetical protein EYC70_01215 [Planctomycetota bacterium]